MYTLSVFGEQLRKIRKYYDKSQKKIARIAGVSSQHWSFVESNKRNFDIKHIIEICELFEIDLNYFFIKGANPEDYLFSKQKNDKLREIRQPVKRSQTSHIGSTFGTSIYKKVTSLLTECYEQKNYFLISSIGDNGVTTTLLDYLNKNDEYCIYFDSIPSLKAINNDCEAKFGRSNFNQQRKLLIFDNYSDTNFEQLVLIIENFRNNTAHSIFVIGNNIKNSNIPKFIKTDQLDSLIREDIKAIFYTFYPDFPTDNFFFIEQITKGRVSILFKIIELLSDKNDFSVENLIEYGIADVE